MQALNAWLLGHDRGLLLTGPDPDSPEPLLHGVVADQAPVPGGLRHRWDFVTVWVRHDRETAAACANRVGLSHQGRPTRQRWTRHCRLERAESPFAHARGPLSQRQRSRASSRRLRARTS